MTSYPSFRSLKPLWVGPFCLGWRLRALLGCSILMFGSALRED